MNATETTMRVKAYTYSGLSADGSVIATMFYFASDVRIIGSIYSEPFAIRREYSWDALEGLTAILLSRHPAMKDQITDAFGQLISAVVADDSRPLEFDNQRLSINGSF